MLSHAALGFAAGLITAGLLSDALDGAYSYVYLSAGGLVLLLGLLLLVRDIGGARSRGPDP